MTLALAIIFLVAVATFLVSLGFFAGTVWAAIRQSRSRKPN
jgi:hypothetical protein